MVIISSTSDAKIGVEPDECAEQCRRVLACTTCNGTGEITRTHYDYGRYAADAYYWIPCPDCGGLPKYVKLYVFPVEPEKG